MDSLSNPKKKVKEEKEENAEIYAKRDGEESGKDLPDEEPEGAWS